MSDAKEITIDGVEYVLVPKEKMSSKPKGIRPTGWERTVNENGVYFSINTSGLTNSYNDMRGEFDEKRFKYGNYFSRKALAEDISRAIRLFLQLNRWQALNDVYIDPSYEWEHAYTIACDMGNPILNIEAVPAGPWVGLFSVNFSSEERAHRAIREFYDDLKWYFEDFLPRMDMEV